MEKEEKTWKKQRNIDMLDKILDEKQRQRKYGKYRKTITFKEGDIRYVSGTGTKVKIINGVDRMYPLCEVLEVGKESRFEIGQKVNIFCKILYPKKGVKVKNKTRGIQNKKKEM
jgi:hypothetical protein